MVSISLCGVKWSFNETLGWVWSSMHGTSGAWQWQGAMAKAWDSKCENENWKTRLWWH